MHHGGGPPERRPGSARALLSASGGEGPRQARWPSSRSGPGAWKPPRAALVGARRRASGSDDAGEAGSPRRYAPSSARRGSSVRRGPAAGAAREHADVARYGRCVGTGSELFGIHSYNGSREAAGGYAIATCERRSATRGIAPRRAVLACDDELPAAVPAGATHTLVCSRFPSGSMTTTCSGSWQTASTPTIGQATQSPTGTWSTLTRRGTRLIRRSFARSWSRSAPRRRSGSSPITGRTRVPDTSRRCRSRRRSVGDSRRFTMGSKIRPLKGQRRCGNRDGRSPTSRRSLTSRHRCRDRRQPWALSSSSCSRLSWGECRRRLWRPFKRRGGSRPAGCLGPLTFAALEAGVRRRRRRPSA
jgi:hypothetical protein